MLALWPAYGNAGCGFWVCISSATTYVSSMRSHYHHLPYLFLPSLKSCIYLKPMNCTMIKYFHGIAQSDF